MSSLAPTASTRCKVQMEQGFEVFELSNERLALAVVPELGARIIWLKDGRTGREWMWHPEGGLKLFRNSLDDDFSHSPLAGLDECLPTIAACSWQQRRLADGSRAAVGTDTITLPSNRRTAAPTPWKQPPSKTAVAQSPPAATSPGKSGFG